MLQGYQTDLPYLTFLRKCGIVRWQKVNDFWPDKAESEWHINFYIKMDDLSNASTLSDILALYDFSKGSAG